jgi:quinol monooxygenase YgiN
MELGSVNSKWNNRKVWNHFEATAMIVVRISLNVLPEKHLEVLQTLLSMIESTGKETGCLGYAVLADIEDKCLFSLLAEWESREDLDRHIRSRRFGVLLGSRTLLCEQPKIQIHTVSNSEGMEAVHAARNKDNSGDEKI